MIASRAVRVVSLVPSVTETLLAWGVAPAACTRFCEQPGLRHVGGTKDPDIGAIIDLRPDLVVLDREENRREDAEALTAAGVAVHVTHVRSLDDVEPMCAALRRAVGLDSVPPARAATAFAGRRRQAFVPIWRRPLMSINRSTYGASMLEALGVDLVTADEDSPYPVVETTEMARRRPELVLLPSEPYPFAARHLTEFERSFPTATVQIIDGQDLFWWGARTAAAYDRLAQSLATPT